MKSENFKACNSTREILSGLYYFIFNNEIGCTFVELLFIFHVLVVAHAFANQLFSIANATL
jgi:hypothetical protein